MKRIADEAEVIVRLDYAGKKAHITVSAWPAMARKMEKQYGESKDGRNTSRSARWTVDLKAISFRRLISRPGRRARYPTLPRPRVPVGSWANGARESAAMVKPRLPSEKPAESGGQVGPKFILRRRTDRRPTGKRVGGNFVTKTGG